MYCTDTIEKDEKDFRRVFAKRTRWAAQVLARSELKDLESLAAEDLDEAGPLRTPVGASSGRSAAAQRALVFWRKAMRRELLPRRIGDLPEGLREGDFEDFHASLVRWLGDRQGPVERKVGGLMTEFFARLLKKAAARACDPQGRKRCVVANPSSSACLEPVPSEASGTAAANDEGIPSNSGAIDSAAPSDVNVGLQDTSAHVASDEVSDAAPTEELPDEDTGGDEHPAH